MRWEYMFVEFAPLSSIYRVSKINDIPNKGDGSDAKMANFCKRLGMDGWEIISIAYNTSGKGLQDCLVVFKKPLVGIEPQKFQWPQSNLQ